MGSASAGIPAHPRRDRDVSMKTTKLSADTAVAQVVKLVQEAQNSMAGSAAADRAVFWLALVALIGVGTLLAGRSLGAAIKFAIRWW